MRKVYLVSLVALTAACAANPRPSASNVNPAKERTVIHLLSRTTFGPRAADVDRLYSIGVAAFLDEQLHPERISDEATDQRLRALTGLDITARRFFTDYYQPMAMARQELTNARRVAAGSARPPYVRWHLLPIAAMSLPGGDKPVSVVPQAEVTPEELRFQRENQQVFDDLQAQKLLRAVYSMRQLQEVLTDFWFNHFNVDARKIEDRPVVVEYERDVIRPRVFGRFRELLEATATSPAMLFYLDNWLSTAAQKGPAPGRGLNENYGRELLELHTLGVDGGYTQRDVVEVARCFTGWTMANPHDGMGFVFKPAMHDRGEKHVLGHTMKAGRGIEDGEEVLDILARHPSTARFIATKLARRFVADDPPRSLVDRVAKTFQHTDGDLREVMRTILTSRELSAPPAYRAKVKSPLEYVASALRATNASVRSPRAFAGTIAAMGEPLYQSQPPTGYADRAGAWINAGTLVSRLNFALALATNGMNAASVDAARGEEDLKRLLPDIRTDEPSAAIRTAVLLGSPAFQRR
jgi:uncharacterized protein (DUF1800 family)